MSGFSNITFPEDVYRWLITMDIITNKGQANQKGIVSLPNDEGLNFQNGFNIAKIIKIILLKNGQSPSDNLKNVHADNSKQTKSNNWNFVWLSFDDLRMQFDNRIKQLILNGQNSLISEIVKQLYEKDDNKNTNEMKKIVLKQKVQQKKTVKMNQTSVSKKDPKSKQKEAQNGVLDIKKINLSKDPDESESSLQFFILLLTQSFNMSIQEVLGLFTNQNKYLAHLVVKGVNQQFDGVKLFYKLLNKHNKKLKSFIQTDPKDAHSCLYAIKPGFISKDQNIAQLTIELFLKLGKIYDWFISDTGKGSTTLFLGIKRHPHLLDLYFDLLMNIIINQQPQFFTKHFKSSFRDSYEMVQGASFMISSLSNSFFKDKLLELGIIDEWVEIALKLFEQNLQGKIMAYALMGQVMNYLPQVIQKNEDYLSIFKNNWKETKMIDFIHLIDKMIMIFEKLAGQKNEMAKTIYQIIIDIVDMVYYQFDKREYLLLQFNQVLPKFPSVPIHFIVDLFKQQKVKNYEVQLIDNAIILSNDSIGLSKIAFSCLKYFMQDSLHHIFFASSLYKICQKIIDTEQGRHIVIKVIKGCLQSFANVQIQKKNPKMVKQQPMYGIKKSHMQKVSEQQSNDFIIKQKMQANWISLVDKLSQLIIQGVYSDLQKVIKQELLQTNSFVKKNHFKIGGKEISQILGKRFKVNKQEELDHDQDYNNRKAIDMLEQSAIRRKGPSQTVNLSRVVPNGPPTLRKQFAEVIQKKKRQEQQRKFEQQRKVKEQAFKKTMVKKQLQKVNLLRGFAQQAQIKQDGFWEKFNKQQNKQLQLYPPQLMQAKDIEVIDNLFKKYHRLLRYLFLKYTSSMYSTRQNQTFNDSKERKQTISVVEMIKFLKQYKLYFLTTNIQVQNLVRDINVKLLNKRETQQLDFTGFQQYIIQFCAIIFTKPHTITAKSSKGQQNVKRKLNHLSHSQIVAQWFEYLRTVFIQKGQKTTIFDQPQAAYFNQTQVIKEFNKKLQEDPGFILPEGYKKVTDKALIPEAKFSNNILKFKQSLVDVYEVLDEIFYENLGFHLIEPLLKKEVKLRVKPHTFVNIKAKILEAGSQTKPRALSSIVQRKTPMIPPVKMLQKKTLSFGMKMGLSYISYKDKLLGQQVAYVIDNMLDAVQKGRNTIDKEKIVNQVVKSRMQRQQNRLRQQQQRKRKMKQRKGQLQKMKKQIQQKKQKQLQQTKQQRQKQQKKKQQRQKRLKQRQQKYLQEQKQKLKEKKEKQQQQAKKKQQQNKKKKQTDKKYKQKFQDFNTKQITKLKQKFDSQSEKKKKQQQQSKQEQVKKQELYKKLRQKISEKDKKAIEIKQKTNEEIMQLYNSSEIKNVYEEFQSSMRGLFQFLMQNTYVSLTEKKLKNQIIIQTWHYFTLVFQLSPLVIPAKDVFAIFRTLTKDKQVSAQYHSGLSFQEFKQALLRIAIRHKTVFNKIAEKIKQDDMTQTQINDVINKDIEEKEKNQFDQPHQIDVKSLLKQQDIKKEFFNHYGDISKVNERTLKGLIYYLKVPRDKQGQEERWRQIISSKVKYNAKQTQQLKQKLNQEYSLKKQQREREKQRIRKRLAASQVNNSMMNSSIIRQSVMAMENSQISKQQAENKEG